jgi:hypothetical protein
MQGAVAMTPHLQPQHHVTISRTRPIAEDRKHHHLDPEIVNTIGGTHSVVS